MRMVRWCIRLTRLTLVCKVIRYRLVQVRQNHKKKKKKRYTCRTCCSLRTSLQLQLHHDQHQGLRCVRCYARRLGDSRRNAHAKAQAALEPGLRQTSHAIVWPLRPPFLSFSLPPNSRQEEIGTGFYPYKLYPHRHATFQVSADFLALSKCDNLASHSFICCTL